MPGSNSAASPTSSASAAVCGSAPAVHRPHRLLGAQLGDFLIAERIACGSMGEVFLATQLSLDRKVAVKTVSKKIARNSDLVQRFLREMRWLAQLDHPNIVKVFAAGEHEGMPYAALEFVDGRNLQEWLRVLNLLPPADAVHIALLCLEALGHAHAKRIIHRDVKPANILISRTGEVKLTDFGLVKAVEDVSLTSTGIGLGTPQYMAPEQIRDAKHADERTDLYGLGSTLYEMVTGHFPFPQTNVSALLQAKLTGKFTPVRVANPQVPEKLELVISKLLEMNPAFRYASCDEVHHDLAALGLAHQSLSFIDAADKVIIQRPWAQPRATARSVSPLYGPAAVSSAPSPDPMDHPTHTPVGHRLPTSRRGSRSSALRQQMWFVRHKDGRGMLVVSRLSTDEVLRGIETKYLDINAVAKTSLKAPFRPLREYDVFRKPMDKRLAKCKVVRRRTRRRWRCFARPWFWGAVGTAAVGIAAVVWSHWQR